jgi:hypothetical protein
MSLFNTGHSLLDVWFIYAPILKNLLKILFELKTRVNAGIPSFLGFSIRKYYRPTIPEAGLHATRSCFPELAGSCQSSFEGLKTASNEA